MRIEAVGPRPTEEVWQRYVTPSQWPGWARKFRDVRGVGDPLEPGARGVVRGPLLVHLPFRIVSVDAAARRWTWRVGLGPVAVVLDHGVDDQGDDTCAWADVHAPSALVLPYAPLARLALRRLVGA